MLRLTKEKVVEKLIDDDIDTTSQVDGQEYLYNILKSGFKGYNNYNCKELEEEYHGRFNEEVEIT